MRKRKNIALDFEIDKLTDCIENTITGDSHATSILPITKEDLATIRKDKKEKKTWGFDWGKEYKTPNSQVYKLTIEGNPHIIQGLISMEIREDHIRVHLLESAKFNKGKGKLFWGVPGNLMAFVCKMAFEKGFEGSVSFTAKTKLIEHYEKTLGAVHFGGHLMVLTERNAQALVDRYYKS
jgi:hypothetical protein